MAATFSASRLAPCGAHRPAASDDLEIEEFDLPCDGPTAIFRTLAIPPDLVDQRFELRHRVEFGQVERERVFGADGSGYLVTAWRSIFSADIVLPTRGGLT